MKIKVLGHSRRFTDGYTIRDLELCFGKDHHKVQMWIENGWPDDGSQGTSRSNGNDQNIHRFCEKQILNFVKAHPQIINRCKVDELWFLDLLLMKGANTSSLSG